MEYVSVKNLEKYLPGYKDRSLSWIKLYFRNAIDTKNNTTHTSIFNDEKFQGLDEIDQIRFLKLACMQADTGKPVPMTDRNVAWMGWNTKKRPKSKTLLMLQSFLIVCNSPPEDLVHQNRIEKNRIEEDKEKSKYTSEFEIFWKKYPTRWIQESDKHVKIGKDLAWQQWQKIGDETHRHILGIISQMKSGRAVPDPWRWLRDKKWKDYDTPKQLDPKIEAKRKERQRQKERDEFGKHYRSKTTEELKKDFESYGCYLHRWLIKEILAERES